MQLKVALRDSTIDVVTDRTLLLEQVGLSLRQRAAFLNIKWLPERLYSYSTLRQLYKKCGIRFK